MVVRSSVLIALGLTLTAALLPLGTTQESVADTGEPVRGVPPPHVWLDAAENGDPVAVGWNGNVFAIRIGDNPHVNPTSYAVIGSDGVPIVTEHIRALAGHVIGHPHTTVRVTIVDDRIDGMILGYEGQHLGFSTENGETRVVRPTESVADLPPLPRRIDDESMPGTQVGGGCGTPITTMGALTGLVSGWPERTIDIALAVDDAYANKVNGDWLAATVALANRLDGFYDHENDLRFAPVHIIRVSQSLFSEPTTNHYLARIASHYDANHEGLYRELVYLMSGTDFSNALGQASCIGGAGHGNSHYATGFMLFEQDFSFNIGPFRLYGDGALKTIAHEVGHQMGVLHEQHNCAEIADVFTPTRPADVCTTMAPFVDLHGVGFSTWSRLTARGLADMRQL